MNIQSTFRLLLEQCLSPPISKWKKQHIFIILTQLIMLDFNLQPYCDQLLSLLHKFYTSFHDQIKCSIQLVKLTNLQELKFISDHQFMKDIFPYKIFMEGRNILKQALQRQKNVEDLQTRSIVAVFDSFINLKDPKKMLQIYSKISLELSQIKDNNFRQYILQFLYL